MEIRTCAESDIPAIVDLLKISLGESTVPKSEAYWRWKHIDNPFGRSAVLVGYEGSKLVGVRAFMRWQWVLGDRKYEAVRAVDTATHPDHRGHGVFNNLTLALLDDCKEEGVDFIFNTPNKLSKPGYFKMGWKEAGKLPVNLKLGNSISIIRNLFGKQVDERPGETVQSYLQRPEVMRLLRENNELHVGSLITAHSLPSLLWRYSDVPVARYFACAIESGNSISALVFYRLKRSAVGLELRVTDIFMNDPHLQNRIKALINSRIRAHKADYATVSAVNPMFRPVSPLRRALSLGPVVTVRDVAGNVTPILSRFCQWSPSVGDLELF